MSALRARCPGCRTLTAVAVDPGYQCHACGREFGAGLVRVPRAWGVGGEEMAEAAWLDVPWPEASVIEEATLAEQIGVFAAALPARPLILGGCCCSHVGAVRELARRHGRLGVVWFDAHGDLNTPHTSASGNAWGMPLRMLIDAGDVRPDDVTLLGARSLDPPEAEFIEAAGVSLTLGTLPEQVYVAFDGDVLDPPDVDAFMPEPDGIPLERAELLLAGISGVLGAGFTGFVPGDRTAPTVARLGHALGL